MPRNCTRTTLLTRIELKDVYKRQDIHLAAAQQVNAKQLVRYDAHVGEIIFVRRVWHEAGVLGAAQKTQPPLARRLEVFRQGAVGMP